jgi:hypothetical protein
LFNPRIPAKRLFVLRGRAHDFLNSRLQIRTLRACGTIGYQTRSDEQDSQDGINGVQLFVAHRFVPAASCTFTVRLRESIGIVRP